MVKKVSMHYNEEYFNWQSSLGEFGGWADLTKFKAYISRTDEVLDFGCGGGYLLKNIDCRKKVGIEINPEAAKTARGNGIEVYSRSHDVPDEYVDIIISNNALEHTLHLLKELKDLHPKLRKGGKMIFVVASHAISDAYLPGDTNQHLYSWSPMNLGNLFTAAGFSTIECKAYIHKWPPKHQLIAKIGGRMLFEIACRIYGRIERSCFQVRIVAKK